MDLMKLLEILNMIDIKDHYQVSVNKFFDKKTGSGASVNEQLTEEPHKPASKKFKKRRVYARFKDNIWAADLTEIGSLSYKNWNVKCLLYVIDTFYQVCMV